MLKIGQVCAEVLSIGDELNWGQVADTNAAWIGGKLFEQGISVRYRQGVNDAAQDIKDAIHLAVSRSQVVFVTGGLGPTDDDLTVDVVAELLDVEAVYEEEHLEKVNQRQKLSPLRNISTRQVRIPKGAKVMRNQHGAAPGFQVMLQGVPCFFFPGVPREMKPMFEDQALKILQEQSLTRPQTFSQTYRIFGLGESEVNDRLKGILSSEDELHGFASLHYRLASPEVLLILVARDKDSAGARERFRRYEEQILERLQGYLYGVGEETLAKTVGMRLRQRGETLSTAESCTGGLLGELITSVAGSSDYYYGGTIAYHNQVKKSDLQVSEDTLQKHGAVSEECVKEMAVGVRLRHQTTYGIAISGVAGPAGGTTEKPVGTVYIALSGPKFTLVEHLSLLGDRSQIRLRAAYTALSMLNQHLSKD